ncbi:unnamed protein product [Lactuca virosa]|uniref:Transmembrane protein n=1 Tax=Lactuca virosa TaxID=75947 RepID=A0AAU9P6X4_9ASTR|nr:unnamed protein product [Lactuca virosa]
MKKKKLPQIRDLNNRNFCAISFKLFLSLFCFISRYSFLEFLRKSFNKLFGLLKRQTRQSSNGINHRNPRVTRNLINHNIELCLLLHVKAPSSPWRRRQRGGEMSIGGRVWGFGGGILGFVWGKRLREMQLEWWRRKDKGEASMLH